MEEFIYFEDVIKNKTNTASLQSEKEPKVVEL